MKITALIKPYKSFLSPSKYRWKVRRDKDQHQEMVEVLIFNKKTEKQVALLVASKSNTDSHYSLTANLWVEHLDLHNEGKVEQPLSLIEERLKAISRSNGSR